MAPGTDRFLLNGYLECGVNLVEMSFKKLQEVVKDGEAWRDAVYRVSESDTTEQQNKSGQQT